MRKGSTILEFNFDLNSYDLCENYRNFLNKFQSKSFLESLSRAIGF